MPDEKECYPQPSSGEGEKPVETTESTESLKTDAEEKTENKKSENIEDPVLESPMEHERDDTPALSIADDTRDTQDRESPDIDERDENLEKKKATVRHEVEKWKYHVIYDSDGGIKFSCSKCNSRYRWRKSLSKHWREKHEGEGPPPQGGDPGNSPLVKGPVKASPQGNAKSQTQTVVSTPYHPAFLRMNTALPTLTPFGLLPPSFNLPFVNEMPKASMLSYANYGLDLKPKAHTPEPKQLSTTPDSNGNEEVLDLRKPTVEVETPLDLSKPGDGKPSEPTPTPQESSDTSSLQCPSCDKEFSNWNEFTLHVRSHYEKSINTVKEESEHMTAIEAAPKQADSIQQCPHCSFVTKYPSQLQKHLVSHSDVRPHMCDSCGHGFKWKWDLDKHKEHVHHINRKRREDGSSGDEEEKKKPRLEMEQPLPASRPALPVTSNLTVEVAQSPDQPSPSKVNLDSSINSDQGDSTKSKKGRKMARVRYQGSDVPLPYMCALCDYRARWPSEIQQHMKNHSDEKPYHCHMCSYKSKWKWDVVKHFKRCGPGTIKDVIDTTKLNPNPLSDKIIYMGKDSVENEKPKIETSTPKLEDMPKFKDLKPIRPKLEEKPAPLPITTEKSTLEDNKFLVNTSSALLTPTSMPEPVLNLPGLNNPFFSYSGMTSMMGAVSLSAMQHIANMAAAAQLLQRKPQEQVLAPTTQCTVCQVQCNSPLELSKHMKTHEELKPFHCADCVYRSRWKCDLKKHCRNYGHKIGKCPPGKRRGPAKSLEESISNDTDCRNCGFQGNDKVALLEHLSSSIECKNALEETDTESETESNCQEEKSAKHHCKSCSFSCQDIGELVMHQKTSHESILPSPPITPRFPTESPPKSSRSRRKATVPVQSLRLPCQHCPHVSTTRADYERHAKCHGAGAVGNFKCKFCDFRCEEDSNLKSHETVHPETLQVELNEEDLEVTNEPMDAQTVGTSAEPHLHTPPADRSPTRSSSQSSVITDHLNNARGFSSCPECPFSSNDPSNLHSHLQKHDNIGLYRCSSCSFGCDELHLWEQHVVGHEAAGQQVTNTGQGHDKPFVALRNAVVGAEEPGKTVSTAENMETADEQDTENHISKLEDDVSKNLQSADGDSESLQCDMCDQRFATTEVLSFHKQQHKQINHLEQVPV